MEIELKLALSTADPAKLAKQLAHMPVLARRSARHLQLSNTYFDTPDQSLRRKQVALRLRRVGSGNQAQWLQTLKMGGNAGSALSRRGEWEASVPRAELDLTALQATPWSEIDADGALFHALATSFETNFERISWLVRRRDRSIVEVSLDVGQIVVDGNSLPVCELELELLAGRPAALFDLAQQFASSIAVMPEIRSKAARGYALAEGSVHLPVRAQPPCLNAEISIIEAAQRVLGEMFGQFTANLNTLREVDAAELVHQARVGWRRFKSAYRLFKPALHAVAMPALDALQPLLSALGKLRDLDVARLETLPQLAGAYTSGNAQREEHWHAMTETLQQASQYQRQAICQNLEAPALGVSLLAIMQWLEDLSAMKDVEGAPVSFQASLQSWSTERVERLHRQLKRALQCIDGPQSEHRARILAKRLRYAIEALGPLLGRRRSKRWYQQAVDLQTRIGSQRDVLQASIVVADLGVHVELAEFLRGVALASVRVETKLS